MGQKEENKKVKQMERTYFLSALLIYICVYMTGFFLLKLIQSAIDIEPVAELVCLIAFFFVARFLTPRILRMFQERR